ncbi:MAG: CRISPR-associated helicase Cas3' [Ignavibacteriales bacterium]|nr:CRISPR-associated helicase Cas3' [Ignavibacteriales bacterium]
MFNLFEVDLNLVAAFAHSSRSGSSKEKFIEHCERTIKYYQKFVSTFEIESIIKQLISCIEREFDLDSTYQRLKKIVYFHDVGKLTKKFQLKLDGENNNETHSDKSFYFLTYTFFKSHFNGEITEKEFFFYLIVLYSVLKHHGKLKDLKHEILDLHFDEKREKICEIAEFLKLDLDEEIIDRMKQDNFFRHINDNDVIEMIDNFSNDYPVMFVFLKLFHSLLISSDYYATAEFTEQREFDQRSITSEVKSKIWDNFHLKYDYDDFINFNVDINNSQSELEKIGIHEIENLNKSKEEKLNMFRSKLNIVAENNLKTYLNSENKSNVYLLNIPTGGGKTNVSMRLALRIMKERNIKKLFYVFPFINIIEQSYDTIMHFTGEENITRLDSRYISPLETDEIYDTMEQLEYQKHIDNLFFNKPVLMLSHVKFFDMMLRNDKNSNYNFFQLANSVVVIDEIQAYNDKVWTEVTSLINSISKFLNTHFIIMSATMPNLESLIYNADFKSLLNPTFRDEVFNSSLFKRIDILPQKDISKEKIPEYLQRLTAQRYRKILVVLNKIIDSYLLFENLQNSKNNFREYKLFLLNSTIPEKRRKTILKQSKEDMKIILIATQSVEAGVDIDFDIGLRSYAPFDSIVQVAGRINRNARKEECKLIVFPDESSTQVYRGDSKSKIMKCYEKDFFSEKTSNENNAIRDFYNLTISEIQRFRNNLFIQNPESNLQFIQNLNFKAINDSIKLIDADTISLFIPYEKEALEIWDEYCRLFENDNNFVQYLHIKDFRTKLILYNINLFNYHTSKGTLRTILNYEIKYGFYFCKDWNEYFSIESGLNVEKFKEIVTSGRGEFI